MSITNDQLVPAFRRSAMTQEDFCAEHGISPHKLRYYLYKKGNRVKPLQQERLSKPALPLPSPSFISFDHHTTSHRSDPGHSFTIITGRFTIDEMGHLLRAMEGAPC
jgi:hypothetical protein